MSDTPIVDRAKIHNPMIVGDNSVEWFNCVPIETARQLERMCEELSNSVRDACHAIAIFGDQPPKMYLDALARWQAMKDQK